jgi:hypothetical protein
VEEMRPSSCKNPRSTPPGYSARSRRTPPSTQHGTRANASTSSRSRAARAGDDEVGHEAEDDDDDDDDDDDNDDDDDDDDDAEEEVEEDEGKLDPTSTYAPIGAFAAFAAYPLLRPPPALASSSSAIHMQHSPDDRCMSVMYGGGPSPNTVPGAPSKSSRRSLTDFA